MELAVDVTADGDGRAHRLHVALLDKDLLYFLAKNAEVTLGQDATVLDGREPRVNIRFARHGCSCC